MKLAPHPPVQLEKTNALALVREITQNQRVISRFPQETEELKKYLSGGITTERAVQLIQIIRKE